ncbi:MAG: tRNA pseudouridine(55) synthase TruB [Bacteroidales bacterium]|nr:tRNA pseudouridine(55) synthase TruB [Bacteroidales bacterium]
MVLLKKEYNFQEGELLLVEKPLEWTSFDVVNKIRSVISRETGQKKIKVGHAGTLDPLATGLLLICTGRFTKKINQLQILNKKYTGTFYIGATTPSFDRETEVDKTFSTDHITNELLQATSKKFIGEIDQVPPLYSAIKIGGTRAYHLARNNQEKKLDARRVTISSFDLLNIQVPNVEFRVICSKGTYIRALARDFGKELNCGAYLTSLCRTRIGEYRLENAITPAMFEELIKNQ